MRIAQQAARWIRLTACVFTLVGLTAVAAKAAPLRLKGEATVGGVFIGEAGLPFSVARGDRLNFLLTIDGVSTVRGESEFFASFTMKVDNSVLTDPDLAVVVENDRRGDSVLSLAEVFFVDDPGGNRDGIFISASHRPFGDRASGRIAGSSSLQFESSIAFYTAVPSPGYPTVMTSESLSLNPQIWNSFVGREFALFFLPNNSRVGAYVDSVALVPEPPVCRYFVSVVIAVLATIRKAHKSPYSGGRRAM